MSPACQNLQNSKYQLVTDTGTTVFSSYMKRALGNVASTTPDIMLCICILILTCGNSFKSSIKSSISLPSFCKLAFNIFLTHINLYHPI